MREISFRGFHPDKDGDTAIFIGGKKTKGDWYYGKLLEDHVSDICAIVYYVNLAGNIYDLSEINIVNVIPETVGRFTGLTDKNGVRIFEGDILKFLDFQKGIVTQECGAFGISVMPYIDWDYLDSEIHSVTGCDNYPYFCRNDNFVSLWEMMWNYNQEERCCNVVEVIGNIYEKPELMKGGEANV